MAIDPALKPLTLRIANSGGQGDLEVDQAHPLAGPFRQSMVTGGVTGDWALLFTRDVNSISRVIGYFAQTKGDRVLFFPGSTIECMDSATTSGVWERLDHVTVDPPRGPSLRSHVTLLKPSAERHIVDYRTTGPVGSMCPWFSFLIQDPEDLLPMPAILTVTFPTRGGDLENFAHRLLGQGRTASIGLPESHTPFTAFVQIDVWVAYRDDWETVPVQPLAWAFKEGILEGLPDHEIELSYTRLNLSFGSDVRLVVVVTQPPGKLRAGFGRI